MLVSKRFINSYLKKNRIKVFLSLLGFSFNICSFLILKEIKRNQRFVIKYNFSFSCPFVKFFDSYILSLFGLIKSLENIFSCKTKSFKNSQIRFVVLRSPFKYKTSREVFFINKFKVVFVVFLIKVLPIDVAHFDLNLKKINNYFGSSVFKNYSRIISLQSYASKKK